MELKYYSNDYTEVIRENLNTYLNVKPVECNPLPVSEWNRWNLYFKNYAAIDATKTIVYLMDHGYRLYEDAYHSLMKCPTKCHFVATKQGVITIPGYEDGTRTNKATVNTYCENFDDYYIIPNLRNMRLLALQKATPSSWKHQVVWIHDKYRHYKYMTICDCDTVEEWMEKNIVKEGTWWVPTIDELLYGKTIQYLLRPLKVHRKSTCKSKENHCWCCQRTTCRSRNNDSPDFSKEKEKLVGIDLL